MLLIVYTQGLIVSVFSLGCLVGALLAGGVLTTRQTLQLLHNILHLVLSDLIGRKFAIVSGGLVFIVGGVLQAAAYFLWYVTCCIHS